MNKKLIKKLRKGEICVKIKKSYYKSVNQEEVIKKLLKVLNKAFPSDGFEDILYLDRFYYDDNELGFENNWINSINKPENMKPVKLKKFFK